MANKIRTLIVDDEPLAIKLLHAKLSKIDNIKIVGQCKNGREAIIAIAEQNPDLVFLDIQMPGMSGLEVVKHLQSDTMPMIVFATAYEQYALDAFDANAVDYVLKPIDDARVKRAVDRAIKRHKLDVESTPDSSTASDNKADMINAVRRIELASAETPDNIHSSESIPTKSNANKIVIKDRDEILLIEQQDIEWIDAAGDYACIHSKGQTYIKRITLKDMIQELDNQLFKRVHRSTIVNLSYIKKVLPHTKGEFFLVLGEFDKVKVSRNYKEVIKDFLAS